MSAESISCLVSPIVGVCRQLSLSLSLCLFILFFLTLSLCFVSNCLSSSSSLAVFLSLRMPCVVLRNITFAPSPSPQKTMSRYTWECKTKEESDCEVRPNPQVSESPTPSSLIFPNSSFIVTVTLSVTISQLSVDQS